MKSFATLIDGSDANGDTERTTAHIALTDTDTGARLVQAARRLAASRTVDQQAAALDDALRLVTPQAERVAALYAPAWPTSDVDVQDLTQEALMEVAAAWPLASCRGAESMMAWISSTISGAVYSSWRRATALEAPVSALANSGPASGAVMLGTSADHEEADDREGESLLSSSVSDFQSRRLASVLSSLMAHDARMLALRAAGHSFRHMGRLTGVSASTAQRRHARAMSIARRVAAEMFDLAA